jgi:hypothetical protein
MFAAAALAALAVGGCGGGDDGGDRASSASSARDTPTKKEFVAQAQAICRDTKAKQKPFSDKVQALPDRTDIKRVAPLLQAALDESRKGLARLRALPAPTEDKALLDAYFTSAERLLHAHKELADAARKSDRPASEKVARETVELSNDERQKSLDYGIQECGTVF